jgi:hypothetical protein
MMRSELSGSEILPLWQAGGYPPPCHTLSQLAALRSHAGGDDIEVVVDTGKHHGNVFQRMCNSLRRIFVADNWMKWPGGTFGT